MTITMVDIAIGIGLALFIAISFFGLDAIMKFENREAKKRYLKWREEEISAGRLERWFFNRG